VRNDILDRIKEMFAPGRNNSTIKFKGAGSPTKLREKPIELGVEEEGQIKYSKRESHKDGTFVTINFQNTDKFCKMLIDARIFIEVKFYIVVTVTPNAGQGILTTPKKAIFYCTVNPAPTP
jgi:hypothetical protein